MRYDTIVRDNFEYFESHLNNKIFLLETNNKSFITIKCESINFAHLIGLKYSTEKGLFRYSPKQFYEFMKSSNEINGLFDLINEDDYNNHNLGVPAIYVEDKNIYFQEIFDSFLTSNGKNIRLYKAPPENYFDADFLHLYITNDEMAQKGYIGIIGSEKNDYFWFNSVYIEKGSNETRGLPFQIRRLVVKDDNDVKEIPTKVYRSPRNKTEERRTLKVNKSAKLNKQMINRVNKKLANGFRIVKGNGKASQFSLMKNKEVLIKDFQDCSFSKTEDGILAFLMDKYPEAIKR